MINETISLDVLDIDNRTKLILGRNGITSVEHILRLSPHSLISIFGINKNRYLEILSALEQINIDVSQYRNYLSKKNKRKHSNTPYPENLLYEVFEFGTQFAPGYKEKLEKLIKTLPIKSQEVLKYRYKEHLSIQECCNKLNIKSLYSIEKREKRLIELLQQPQRAKYLISDIPFLTLEESAKLSIESIPIINAGFSVKTTDILLKEGYDTLGDIKENINTISSINNLGTSRYNEIINKLLMFGMPINTSNL